MSVFRCRLVSRKWKTFVDRSSSVNEKGYEYLFICFFLF